MVTDLNKCTNTSVLLRKVTDLRLAIRQPGPRTKQRNERQKKEKEKTSAFPSDNLDHELSPSSSCVRKHEACVAPQTSLHSSPALWASCAGDDLPASFTKPFSIAVVLRIWVWRWSFLTHLYCVCVCVVTCACVYIYYIYTHRERQTHTHTHAHTRTHTHTHT